MLPTILIQGKKSTKLAYDDFSLDNVKIHGQVMVMTSHFLKTKLTCFTSEQLYREHLMFLYRKWDNFLSFFKSWHIHQVLLTTSRKIIIVFSAGKLESELVDFKQALGVLYNDMQVV